MYFLTPKMGKKSASFYFCSNQCIVLFFVFSFDTKTWCYTDHSTAESVLLGPFCSRHGTVPLQWSQHDGVSHTQHWKLSGVINHREVVDGAATSPTQTGLGPAGWIHDSRQKPLSYKTCMQGYVYGSTCPSDQTICNFTMQATVLRSRRFHGKIDQCWGNKPMFFEKCNASFKKEMCGREMSIKSAMLLGSWGEYRSSINALCVELWSWCSWV